MEDSKHKRIIDDIKERNKNNMKIIAHDYFGSQFNYKEAFDMIDDYKKAFIALDGLNSNPITISAPSTVASVNSFYGAMDANKIANLVSPGFLSAYTKEHTTDLSSQTLVIFDGFLNEGLIKKLDNAGVRNVIITSITDYMNPFVKKIAGQKGLINTTDFLDEYVRQGKYLPKNINFIRMREFSKEGKKIKQTYDFPYEENRICAYFLTGATTSRIPKCVKLYEHGFNNMAIMYDKLWFDFMPGDRQALFIPLFYATGAIHGVHAGMFSGMTIVYKPKYDRFAFGKDLVDSKAKIALVAPSHVATLESSGLKENSLNHVKYIFIGGEAIMPAQMRKFRETTQKLGVKYLLNAYGMTETASMTGMSDKEPLSMDDVTVLPTPGVEYRIVDPDSGEIVPDGTRGILEKNSPCKTAGYLDSEKNKKLFTSDGWINTGDVAVKYPNGRYRIFGRSNDFFENSGIKYAMFDIEERVLEHPSVSEAEVIKFKVNDNEIPAIIIVLKPGCENDKQDVLKYISNIGLDSIKFLMGTKFIDKFLTNPITSKRDYLILNDDTSGYYKFDLVNSKYRQTDLANGELNEYDILPDEIAITESEKQKQLIKK